MTKRKSTSQKKPVPAKQSASPATAVRHLPTAAELLQRKKTEEAAAKAAARAKNAPPTVKVATPEVKAVTTEKSAPAALPPLPAGVKERTGGSSGNARGRWCAGANLPAGAKVAHPSKPGDYSACPVCGKILKTNIVKLKAGPSRQVSFHYVTVPKKA